MDEEQGTTAWKVLPGIDRDCFGCGGDNRHGLHMRFATNGRQLRSTLTIPDRFRGWSNLVHGGVLATVLDETMGWTVIVLTGRFMLTRQMTITFRKPVRIGASLTALGSIKSMNGERRAVVAAEVLDEEGAVCAAAEGDFALFTREQFRRLNVLPEKDMDAMLAAMQTA